MMPDLLPNISLEQRLRALRDYLASAQDIQAAVDFLVEALDPETDQALLSLVEDLHPAEFTHTVNQKK